VNPEYIRRGQLQSWIKPRFDAAVAELSSDRRFHLFAGNMGKKTEDVDTLIQELNPDIIYIDGMYLMKPLAVSKARNRYDSVAYVLDDLKEMTITRDRPIIATTQFGRTAGKGGEEGSLENIGYTDAISTHASIIPSVMPPNRKRQKHYGHNRFREIAILKGREGESQSYISAYSFAPVTFAELEPPPPDAPKGRRGRSQEDDNEDAPEHVRRGQGRQSSSRWQQ
jgi:hypothetical protein